MNLRLKTCRQYISKPNRATIQRKAAALVCCLHPQRFRILTSKSAKGWAPSECCCSPLSDGVQGKGKGQGLDLLVIDS